MKRIISILLAVPLIFSLSACRNVADNSSTVEPSETQEPVSSALSSQESQEPESSSDISSKTEAQEVNIPIPDSFVLIRGDTFQMGRPDSEPWRGQDETQHSVTVSDFYMDSFELTPPGRRAAPGGYTGAAGGMTLRKTCARLTGQRPQPKAPALILESGLSAMRRLEPEMWRGHPCRQIQMAVARC